MTIQEVVARFNTTPFIFAGSGITRRYYGLPDWVGLLTVFAERVKADTFAYRSYESKAGYESNPERKLPLIASLIEADFNELWFNDAPGIRTNSTSVLDAVEQGCSPFKAEIGAYIKSKSIVLEEYTAEVAKLQEISRQNISGIITTNYDEFFENTVDGYAVYVGQDELVFSQLQGIAEIYKIHGSVAQPKSIIINQNDYEVFRNKGKYLAAKLMTVFMEYPIIFMGYSLSDQDIQQILSDIVLCLPDDKVSRMQTRLIFVEYKPDEPGEEVSSNAISVNGKVIEMTKISLSDFSILYDALARKKAAFPVKILRRFKDDLYTFALSQELKPTMKVAALEDTRIDENTLALTIGLLDTGHYGLERAVDSEHWYKNIIFNDSPYTADELLEYVYPELVRQSSGKLPVWYYIRNAKKKHLFAEERAPKQYSEIVSVESIKRNRTATSGRTAFQLWSDEKNDTKRAVRLLGYLPERSISADELQLILEEIFRKYDTVFDEWKSSQVSTLRRLIRIYDFLKYGENKTP